MEETDLETPEVFSLYSSPGRESVPPLQLTSHWFSTIKRQLPSSVYRKTRLTLQLSVLDCCLAPLEFSEFSDEYVTCIHNVYVGE